jgi:hypothetical protein
MITNLARKNQNQDQKKKQSAIFKQPATARRKPTTVQSAADKIRAGFINPLYLNEFHKSTPRTRNPASDLSQQITSVSSDLAIPGDELDLRKHCWLGFR